jgi:uncharacterized membrane protein
MSIAANVVIALVAATVNRRIVLIQASPAAIALGLALAAR